MNYTKSKFPLFLLFIVFFSNAANALSQETGAIHGKVTDASTGELMRGATVAVEGTKKGAYSDVKGTFTVKNVPVGTYSLKITFVGYETRIIAGVVVEAGKTTTQNVILKSEVTTTQDVVVTATRSMNNQDAMLQQQKNASQVSNSISQEEISKLPDANAGQALQRVSGVTLVNDKFIYVRGVSERYSNTTLNGAMLTSTEPDKKAFSFDMFPSEFLENATVTKSFTPDLPGNFAGGLVQLNTVDFPQGFGIKVNASSSYNSNTTFQSGQFNSYQGGASDWMGKDDGTRSMPGGAPASRTEMNELLRSIRNVENTAQREQWVAMGQSFNSNVWNRQQLTANPNSSVGLSFGNIFNIADNDFGVIASANYGNSFNINKIERNAIMGDRSFIFKSVGSQSTRSVNLGGLLNFAYKIGTHSSISFKNVFNRSSDDETVTLFKTDSIQRRDLQLSSYEFVSKELLTSQLGGEHTLPQDMFMGGTLLDWRMGYSKSTRDQPDFRRLRYSRELGMAEEPFRADIQQTAQGDGTSVGRFFSNLNESGVSGGVNASVPVGTFKIKVGGALESKDRTFRARSFTIIQSPAVVPNQDFNIDLAQSPDSLFRAENFRLDGLGISEDSKESDKYDASEDLTAAYAMMDIPFQLGALDFRFIGGARFENSTQRIFNTASVDNKPVDASLITNDVLPSINLIWRATEDMNLRMSASQTLTRPSLREFAPFEFYDFQMQSRIGGNPFLNRSLIQNYDIRFELFPNIGEVVSASVFYKNFKNAIEETIKPTGGGEPSTTFSNAEGPAKIYGLELEFRKSLSFISDYFSNFMMSSNLSFINSEISVLQGNLVDKRQMWGQSPYTINASLYFVEPTLKTALSLGYNSYGRRIIRVAQQGTADQPAYNFADPHVYELPRDVVDFSIVQPIADMIEVKFVVRDLLNQPLVWEQGGTRVASNLRGRNFSISLGYRVQ